MKNKKPINENELDGLLRDLYLEENSKTVNEKEAQFVFEKDYPVNIDAKKEEQLIKKLQRSTGGFGGLNFYASMIGMACVVTALLIYFISKTNTEISNNSNQVHQTNTSVNSQIEQPQSPDQQPNGLAKNNDGLIKLVDTFGRPKIVSSIPSAEAKAATNNENENTVSNSFQKTVPFLTEKDRIRYTKVKTQIIQKLLKSDKGLYTRIDANKVSYANKTVILDAFMIRNMSITNLEYKTFLADLLIQKRNEDYFTAQVISENWSKFNYNTIANTYFQNEKYNDFPVVNVTCEGAKLFCRWLESETKFYIQQNNLKVNPIEIRLPYDDELIYAAREGYAKIAFEKGYNTIYDMSEGLVDKTFTGRAELIKKRVKRVDTLYDFFTTNRYGWNEKEIMDFLNKGFNYYNTSSIDTIYTERMKVFGKIGRVSEIISQKNSSHIWLTGLSWKNKNEYLKLDNEFKTNASSPFVGFRIVVVNPNGPEYKNPFY